MTRKVVKPIALDESLNTTEETPRNIADVLAEGLAGIGEAVSTEAELPLKKVNGKLTNNGNLLTVTGNNAWAEGERTEATAGRAHAEGYMTKASAADAHAEGSNTRATGVDSHAEGAGCTASGKASHAGGRGTRMSADGGTAIGNFNADDTALFVVGDGTDGNNRSDAFKVDSNGRTHIKNEAGNLVKIRGAGIAKFTVTQTDVNTYTYPNESDVRTAISNYDTVILRLAPLDGGFTNYILDHQAVAVGVETTYTWVREDGSRVITLEGAGSPVVWTWTESSRSIGGGGGIYDSLQDAIADAANLNVGDIFETNGFHISGDGGAARYLVSSTGTANGMDIVSMGSGKLAVLQINQNREMYPEQFGYDRFASQDVTPVFTRMASQNIRNIRLLPCGSDNYPYLMKTGWSISSPDISITGYSGLTTGYASRIWFKPDSYSADVTPMFSPTKRGFKMKDIVILNLPWFTEGDKHNCVAIYMATTDTNKMWYDFDNLAIQGFDIGIAKLPPSTSIGDGLIWHCEFHKLQMGLNNKNVYLKGLSYVTKFDNCFFTVNESDAQSIVVEESFTVEFDRCNFGIYNPADTIVKCQDYLVTGKPVDVRVASLKFTNCNFELESDADHPLPTDKNGIFVKCEDHDDFYLEFDTCCFIDTPLVRNNIYSDTLISLGENTSILMTNCNGPYSDVNYSGNEFYSWDFQKRFFARTKHPKKAVGSVVLEHCIGIIPPPNNAWGSVYLPVVKTDDMTCPQCDNDTDFLLNYPTAKDGLMLMNLDTAGVNTKIGNSLVQVVSPQTGKVRIGDRIYDYVVIDGRKWITTNLQLWTMNTRQWHFPAHPEFGFYYGVETFPEIDALLPAGWRRPNYADCQSIISQGYAAVQATGQSAFPNATNITGLSLLPGNRWFPPNTTVNFERSFFWGPEESGVGYHAVLVQASSISYAGWPYSDIGELKIPIRVCCDA